MANVSCVGESYVGVCSDPECVFVQRAEEDAEKLRRCLAEAGLDPDRVYINDRGHAAVGLSGYDDDQQRLVWRAWRLVDPVNVPDTYEGLCTRTPDGKAV